MKKIYFGDFRLYVNKHIKEIEKAEIEAYTIEWFLVRYLKKITKVADGNIENAQGETDITTTFTVTIE